MSTKTYDFTISSLGEAKVPNPIIMGDKSGDVQVDYVRDSDHILFGIEAMMNEVG
ncbi:MAG: ATP-dependent 6-phosphofructokinase, partial [Spirochaetales bacterium]|nr:ATP-dependent 6-phosphofructokinase [Spirochaetales bacterium]